MTIFSLLIFKRILWTDSSFPSDVNITFEVRQFKRFINLSLCYHWNLHFQSKSRCIFDFFKFITQCWNPFRHPKTWGKIKSKFFSRTNFINALLIWSFLDCLSFWWYICRYRLQKHIKIATSFDKVSLDSVFIAIFKNVKF